MKKWAIWAPATLGLLIVGAVVGCSKAPQTNTDDQPVSAGADSTKAADLGSRPESTHRQASPRLASGVDPAGNSASVSKKTAKPPKKVEKGGSVDRKLVGK